jgi:hypothetical protein
MVTEWMMFLLKRKEKLVKLSPARVLGDRTCELDVLARTEAKVCIGHGFG